MTMPTVQGAGTSAGPLPILEDAKQPAIQAPLPRAADFDVVSAAAAATNRQVFVAENYHYKPLLVRLRKLLAEQVVGDVLFVQINAIKKQQASGDWRDDPALALGGALYEGGIHWIDFMASMGMRVRRVAITDAPPAGSARAGCRS